jgi:hypothetical protein
MIMIRYYAQWKSRTDVLIIFIIVSILFIFLACSRGPSRKAVVASYERMYNAHQIDSLLALFADDAQYEFTGMGMPLVSKNAIAQKARYDSVLDSQIKIIIKRTNKDTLFTVAGETNNWQKAAGLSPNYYSSLIFVIDNGKIRSLRAELADSSVAAVNKVMESLIPWAEENTPEKLDQMISGGAFSYTSQSAVLSLELLKQWKHHAP